MVMLKKQNDTGKEILANMSQMSQQLKTLVNAEMKSMDSLIRDNLDFLITFWKVQ
jgi:hypothetical protein